MKARTVVLAFAVIGCLACSGWAGTLGGVLTVDLRMTQSPSHGIGFFSTLQVDYTTCGWVLTSSSVLGASGYEVQTFRAAGVLGAVNVAGGVTFQGIDIPGLGTLPMGYAYSWFDASLELAGVRLAVGVDNMLSPYGFMPVPLAWPCYPQTGSYTLASLMLDTDTAWAMIYLDSCGDGGCGSLGFGGFRAGIDCIELCGYDVGAEVSMVCGDFEYAVFSVDHLALSGIPWLLFDFEVMFETQTKSATLTPALDFGDQDCLEFIVELIRTPSGHGIDGLRFNGFSIEHRWPAAYFKILSAFSPADPGNVIPGRYWEMFEIGTIQDACCGGGLEFRLGTYFAGDSDFLFDWAKTVAEVAIGVGSNLFLTGSLEINDTAGIVGGAVGIMVRF